MVKNCGKGGKSHRKMKSDQFVDHSQMLVFKDGHDQEYAYINDMLGNNRVRCTLHGNNNPIIGIICGKMRKRHIHRISKNDVVLVSIRSFQDDKVDVIHVYNDNDIKQLISYKEISQTFLNSEINELSENANDDFTFENV